MSASEKLKGLDERASDLTLGFIMGEDDGTPSPWPPNIKELERLRVALPQIVAVVEAAEAVDPRREVMTHSELMKRKRALRRALAALKEALQ